jgi:hypothetical protein
MKIKKIIFHPPSEKTLSVCIIFTLLVFNIVLLGVNRSLSTKLMEIKKLNDQMKIENAFSLDGQNLINQISSFMDAGEFDLMSQAEIKIFLFIRVRDCRSCKATLFDWNYVRQYFDKKVQIVGIIQNSDLQKIDELKTAFHVKYKTIIDSSCDFFRFLSSETATPAAVLLNKKNEVIAIETPHSLPRSRKQLKDVINKLLEQNLN